MWPDCHREWIKVSSRWIVVQDFELAWHNVARLSQPVDTVVKFELAWHHVARLSQPVDTVVNLELVWRNVARPSEPVDTASHEAAPSPGVPGLTSHILL